MTRALVLREELRVALLSLGEDPDAVERYLASDLADMRRKGEDRVRAAEARIRRAQLSAKRDTTPANITLARRFPIHYPRG